MILTAHASDKDCDSNCMLDRSASQRSLDSIPKYKPVSQSCAVAESNNKHGWPQETLPKFGFRAHTFALWPMEQPSILSAKFDCPVARQNFSLLATAHDCEIGLLAQSNSDSRIYTATKLCTVWKLWLLISCWSIYLNTICTFGRIK